MIAVLAAYALALAICGLFALIERIHNRRAERAEIRRRLGIR